MMTNVHEHDLTIFVRVVRRVGEAVWKYDVMSKAVLRAGPVPMEATDYSYNKQGN